MTKEMEPKLDKYSDDFLKASHKSSSCHKEEILSGKLCGCFYCGETFSPTEINEWIDENNNRGETAICPKCGIDSVLSSKLPIDDDFFLSEMNKYWF
jgi:hypothetical protein